MSGTDLVVASQRDAPWYGSGVQVDHAMSVDEALTAADLDWAVDTRPAGYLDETSKFIPIEGRYATRRVDTGQGFDFVGRNYQPWSNRQAFEFADALVDGGLTFDAAGSYRGGRRVFLSAKVPETMRVLGQDPYELYLFLLTSHDGKTSIQARVVPLRLRCTNQFGMALRSAKTTWAIRHTSSAEGRLQEAREALELTFAATSGYQHELEALAAVDLTERHFRAIVAHVLPETPKVEERIEDVVELWRTSETIDDDVRGTRYGALQAFTEWVDWGRPVRSDQARFTVSFDGYGARWRNRFYELVAS